MHAKCDLIHICVCRYVLPVHVRMEFEAVNGGVVAEFSAQNPEQTADSSGRPLIANDYSALRPFQPVHILDSRTLYACMYICVYIQRE